MKSLFLLVILIIIAGCQAKGGGVSGGGIISGHVPVDNKFTLTTPNNITYIAGQTIPFTATFPLDVTVSGNPKLTVTIGSSIVDADFVSVAGNALLFEYVVQVGDSDLNGISVSGTMNFNGATLTFNSGENCNTTVIVPSLATVKVSAVAGAAPVANNITPSNFNEDASSTITLNYIDGDGDLATSCAISSPTKVTVTTPCSCAAGVCTVGVTGILNQNGAAGFGYTVTSLGQTSNTAAATFTLNPMPDAPVATNVTPPAFNEDTISTITLPYTDVDGDAAATCSTSSLSNVTVTTPCACAAGVCTVSVQGTSNYSGAAGFSFSVTANGQTSNTALAGLTITAINDAPVNTTTTAIAFNEDTQSIITLNYTDAESQLATACSVTVETNVTETQACACAAGVCTVGVTGTPNYFGAGGALTYSVTAGAQSSTPSVVTFSITAVDDKPVGNTLTPASFPENTQSVITLTYSDVESHLATTCSVTGETNITETQACACAAGTCTVGVTGTLNYVGAASFNYTVTANGLTSDAQVANLTITNVDAAPVATNITPGPFAEDSVNTITLNYTDADSDQATTCSVTGETNLTESTACACAAGVCTVGITGAANYFGAAATFNYTVTANGQTSNSATATITYTAVDDKPVGTTTTAPNFNKNTQSIITLAYTDVESHLATTCAVSSLSNVTETQACACAAGTCTVGVTGTSNYFGAAGLSYTVTANGLASDAQSVNFTIDNSNTPPVATNITPSAFNEDVQSGIITLAYTDVDTDLATSCAISSPTNVTVTTPCACSSGTCTVRVTGTANYNGAASFTYTVTANGQASNSATATLSITSIDDAPVTTASTPATVAKNTQVIITLPYTDVESHQATTCSTSSLSNVTVTQACACAAGVCTVGVTGTPGYAGSAGFDFTVTANTLVSNSSAAAITITNTAPVATNITPAAFNEDVQSGVITLAYTDADSDLGTSCAISSPTNVTVTTPCACSSGTCTVRVTGTSNYNGSASFAYTVTAGGQASNSATATLSITAVDDAPTGVPLTPPAFNEDTQSIITLTYSDVEGNQAATCAVSGLTNVTATQACSCTLGTCTVGVTGLANYNGTASFNYTVTANGLTSAAQPASLTISSVADAPTTANLTPPAFNEDVQSVITLSYTAVGGDQATTCAVTSPVNVTVTQACACAAGTCTVGVTGTPNYNGAASFQWTVSAGPAQSVSRNAALTINPADDAASLSAIGTQTITPNTSTSAIAFTFNDNDGSVCSSARLSMSSSNTTKVPNANVVWGGTAPNCTATITPAVNQTGTVTITITATDGGLANKTTAFTLNINGPVLVWEFSGSVITIYNIGTPGGNTTRTFQLRNIGNVTTSAAATITDDGGSNRLSQTNNCAAAGTLIVNEACDVTVSWNNSGGGGVRTEVYTGTAGAVSADFTFTGTK